MNDDSLADIVIGAPATNSGAGAVFVLYGKHKDLGTLSPVLCRRWTDSLYAAEQCLITLEYP